MTPRGELINGLLTDAVKRGASESNRALRARMRVRYRVDGRCTKCEAAGEDARGAHVRASRSWRSSTSPSGACPRNGRIKLKMGPG